MKSHKREIRRQILHLLYGPLIVGLFEVGILNLTLLFFIIIIGAGTSLMIKRRKLNPIAKLLSLFERDHHMEKFPGRGILFFSIGAYLCLLLFSKDIAYAGIMILSVGDAISNLFGRHFGRIPNKLNPKKHLEGTILGILVSMPIAYYFLPNWYAAGAAAIIAMFLEIPNVRLFNFEIDDNIIIPLAASFTLNLFA